MRSHHLFAPSFSALTLFLINQFSALKCFTRKLSLKIQKFFFKKLMFYDFFLRAHAHVFTMFRLFSSYLLNINFFIIFIWKIFFFFLFVKVNFIIALLLYASGYGFALSFVHSTSSQSYQLQWWCFSSKQNVWYLHRALMIVLFRS